MGLATPHVHGSEGAIDFAHNADECSVEEEGKHTTTYGAGPQGGLQARNRLMQQPGTL